MLVACLTCASIPVLHKHAGVAGAFACVLLMVGGAVWWCRAPVLVKAGNLSTTTTMLIMAGLLLLMGLLFMLIYPTVNTAQPGLGSDRDDALNMAVQALLHGEHPYRQPTYLGNPVTPLPGALLLALPFVLLGNSAYQNLFWLAAFAVTVGAQGRRPGYGVWVLALLLLSPALWQDFLTGGDLLANSLYVSVFSIWLIAGAGKRRTSALSLPGLSLLLGLGLASRPHFSLILPLVFAVIARERSWQSAAACLGVTLATMAALIVPLYLFDPAAFTPLHVAGKLQQFNVVLPYAAFWLPATLILVSLVAAAGANAGNVLFRLTLVLAVPIVAAAALDSLSEGRLSVTLLAHGLNFMFFGVAASCAALLGAPTTVSAPRATVA